MNDRQGLEQLKFILKKECQNLIEDNMGDVTFEPDSRGNVIALHINHLRMKSVPDIIWNFAELQQLDLCYNELTIIPMHIVELKQLQEIWLNHNNIQEIPEYLFQLPKLKRLYISDNPLVRPPESVAKKGISAIKAFYHEAKGDERSTIVNECKLLIVGHGDVGKTCVANRLMHNTFNKQDRTRGIQIFHWKAKVPDASAEMLLNIWDFGGQEIYHSTHQFFLTKRSIYLLVWNARKARDYEHIYSWLNIIDAYSENSPILLVMSKYREMNDDLNMRDIKARYPQVVGLYKVDSEDGFGFEELSRSIRNTAWQLPIMRTPWLKSWFDVRKLVETDTRNWMSKAEFRKQSLSIGVSETSFEMLDEYLHDIGIIMHYDKDIELKGMVILKPEWATKAVYKILDDERVKANEGILKDPWLDKIWSAEDYPADVHSRILGLMNKFELSYSLSNKQSHLVAELLPSTEPLYRWEDSDTLKLYYRYDFLPSGVMTRFIVLTHDYIEKRKNGLPFCWREGVLLSKSNSKALVLLNAAERRIEITIKGDRKDNLLSIISNNFDQLNSRLKRISYEKCIPCNCSEACSKLWNYEKLLRLERRNIEDILCEDTGDHVDIPAMLDKYEARDRRVHGIQIQDLLDRKGITINVVQNNKQNTRVRVKSTARVTTTINLKYQLPELQQNIQDLQEEIEKVDPSSGEKLDKIVQDIARLKPESPKRSFKGAIGRLQRLLMQIDDENSSLGKTILGIKKAVGICQRLGRIYNKFAQWLLLPNIPDIFLGR